MIMETLSCGYPVGPAGLGSSSVMTPPSTPPDSNSFTSHDCSPQLYSETQYTQTAYSSSPIHHGTFVPRYLEEEDDANNNSIYGSIHDDQYNNNSPTAEALMGAFSSLSVSKEIIEEEDEDQLRMHGFSTADLTPPVSESSETDEVASRVSPPRSTSLKSSNRPVKAKKNSRSKAKTSTESVDSGLGTGGDPSSRKDSFVYDVRLPDEQFLFFVPDLDLVKSHLMFAVREEVDVLKDRIVELMDRIKHLECENTVLRQYASPEVLQQLQTQIPHQIQQPPHHSSTS